MQRIGIAGLGRMGGAIAARLLETGAEVAVWNRSPGKAEALAAQGALLAATPAALAEACGTVITIVTDGAAQQAIYAGPEGLLAAARGRLFIEMSTVRPEVTQALAAQVQAAGGAFVECPVGGTTGPARQGRLLGLAGGAAEDVARARPVLERLCRRIDHVGPVGAGASMKLAINLPLALYYQALGEAVSLCAHVGLDPALLVEIFGESTGGSNVLKVRGPAIAKVLAGGDAGFTGFDLDGVRKDMRVMLEEAASRGAALPMTALALSIYDRASAEGLGGQDGAALPGWWVRRGSVAR